MVAADGVGRAVRLCRHLHVALIVRDEHGKLVLLGDTRNREHIKLTDNVRVRALHELALLGEALHRGAQLGLLGAEGIAAHLVIEYAARKRERNHDEDKV